MNAEFLAFFILSLFAIGGAVFMINLTNVMHMALSLAFTFLSVAGIYFLLDAEFVGVVQILIYTGAITILMLFGIMLTKHKKALAEKRHPIREWGAFLLVGLLFGMIIFTIYQVPIDHPTQTQSQEYSVAGLGEMIFTDYVIAFELTSILLLVALIGAILLARREEE